MAGEHWQVARPVFAKMPRRVANKVLMDERARREHAELRSFLLKQSLDRHIGDKPPVRRHGTQCWDWHCRCGNLVWAGRMSCTRCQGRRADGYTLIGSVRGEMQNTPAPRQPSEQQRQVPGRGLTKLKMPVVADRGHAPARQPNSSYLEAAPGAATLARETVAQAPTIDQPMVEVAPKAEEDDVDPNPTYVAGDDGLLRYTRLTPAVFVSICPS